VQKADLHIHSTHSDGSLSVEEIILKAKAHGLSAISITDHDCIDAYPEALEIGKKHGIRVMVGCKFSCVEDGREHHLLGFNFDINNTDIQIKLSSLKQDRLFRAQKTADKLNEMGVDITFEEIEKYSEHGVIGRLNIAKALVGKGITETTDEAFMRYLSDRAPAYVNKSEFIVKNAIKLIHRAGGVASLAHPDKRVTNSKLYDFIRAGLDGIEVVHPYLNEARSASIRASAKQYQLLQTGGSDYHGNKEHEEMMFGNKIISDTILDAIEKRCLRYR
jgi:predicted metal-dependent phosphoesterase TrpH